MFLTGNEYEGNAIDAGAGLFYHVAGNVGLNLYVKYGFMSSDDNQIDNQSRMFIGLGISGFIF